MKLSLNPLKRSFLLPGQFQDKTISSVFYYHHERERLYSDTIIAPLEIQPYIAAIKAVCISDLRKTVNPVGINAQHQ